MIKGQNLRVFLNGDVISAALSCDIRIAVLMRNKSTKDTVGQFSEREVEQALWEVTATAAVWTGEGPGASTADLLAYHGQEVTMELNVTDGDYNASKSDTLLRGTGILSAITVNSKNRENATCTVVIRGRGNIYQIFWLCDNSDMLICTSDGIGLTVRG